MADVPSTETPLPRPYRFFVAGNAVTQGSKVAGVNRHTGKAFMKDDSRDLKAWRNRIATEAQRVRGDDMPLRGPVIVECMFWKQRPQAEPKRRRTWPTAARSGDVDKLLRACLDALTGILFEDDSQVVWSSVGKDWAGPPWHPQESPGVWIDVEGVPK